MIGTATIPVDKLVICSVDEARLKGVYPNRLAWIECQKMGALVVYQSPRGADFAAGKVGIDYLSDALAKGKIDQAYVLLMRPNAAKPELLGVFSLDEILAVVASLMPRQGQWGEYYWLSASIMGSSSVPF